MKNNYQRIAFAAAIAGLLLTAFFIVLSKTALLSVAYIFVLLGVFSLAASAIYLSRCSAKNYIVRIPFVRVAFTYAISQLLLSIVCIGGSYLSCTLPASVFCLLHVLLLAFFAWRLLALDAGREHIEGVAATVELKTSAWKDYVLRLQELKMQATGKKMELAAAKEFSALLDAASYADPVSHKNIMELEKEIFSKTSLIEDAIDKGDVAALAAIAGEVQLLVLQRNNSLKAAK